LEPGSKNSRTGQHASDASFPLSLYLSSKEQWEQLNAAQQIMHMYSM